MKKLALILVVISSLIACSEDSFVGSGDTISEIRNVDYFNEVSSEGTFEVNITQGSEQSIEIVADYNVMHRVKTDVVNGRLNLHLADGRYNNVHLEAHITVLDLTEIRNAGDGDIHISNILGNENFKVFNSGSANIYLEGSSDKLDIQNEGSGDVLAYDMPTDDCNIKNEGSGKIEVSCVSTLNVRIKGSGDVYYQGSPIIDIEIEGSGKLISE